MIWRRAMLVALLAITGLALQTAVVGRVTLLGTRPELLLLVTVALAIGEGPELGATAGFVMGLLTDALGQGPAGIHALSLTLVGYGVGAIRAQLQAPSAWLPMAMVSLATVAGVLLEGALLFLLGAQALDALQVARYAGLAAVYNVLLTPFAFPVVRVIGARLRPAGVAR